MKPQCQTFHASDCHCDYCNNYLANKCDLEKSTGWHWFCGVHQQVAICRKCFYEKKQLFFSERNKLLRELEEFYLKVKAGEML